MVPRTEEVMVKDEMVMREFESTRAITDDDVELDDVRSEVYVIPTHVHVVHRSDGTGLISRDEMERQLQVLNDAFAGRRASYPE